MLLGLSYVTYDLAGIRSELDNWHASVCLFVLILPPAAVWWNQSLSGDTLAVCAGYLASPDWRGVGVSAATRSCTAQKEPLSKVAVTNYLKEWASQRRYWSGCCIRWLITSGALQLDGIGNFAQLELPGGKDLKTGDPFLWSGL